MLDVKKILARSWNILWNYRILWVFGFMLALATGSGGGGGNSGGYSGREEGAHFQTWSGLEKLQGATPRQVFDELLRLAGEALRQLQAQYPVEFQMGLAAIVFALIVFSLFGLALTVLRYVAETAVIRMVDEYEQSETKVGFWQGWRYGWSRTAWRVFLVDVVVNLPALLLVLVILLVIWWIFSAALSGVRASLVTALIGGIGLVFVTVIVLVVILALLRVLGYLAWRFIVLEQQSTLDSLRSAFELAKRQWKNVGLMWLVMIGVSIAWALAFFILIWPLLAVSILTAVAGFLTALFPALLTAGAAALFSAPDYWPWIFAAITAAPIFFTIAFAPIFLVSGWFYIYQSSVWTLTYRELKVLEGR
ncbi:MAG: hypothetical protein NZP74_09570 [Anaerolineales bacterium]|nr:hypothetical protein [Anaerolineales bacterium]MDW8277398.1 hypothetical protein [Anaerolineales bacterium]